MKLTKMVVPITHVQRYKTVQISFLLMNNSLGGVLIVLSALMVMMTLREYV